MKAVGARLPRYDGVAHVTGRTQYVDDVRVPNMLWAKALRSPVHHAGITQLDTAKAAAIKGVRAIVTWEDVPQLVYGHLEALGIPGRRAAARQGRGPLQGSADRAGRRRGRGDRAAGRRGDRDRLRRAAGPVRRPQGGRPRRADDPPVGQLVPALRGGEGRAPDPQGRHRPRLRPGRHDRLRRLPAGGDRALPDGAADRAGRPGAERAADDLLVHAGALLLDGRRRRAPAGAAEQAEVRRRHGRRRLRRQGRHGDRDDLGAWPR